MNFMYNLLIFFLIYTDFLKAGVIHGFEISLQPLFDNCLTGICLSMTVDIFQ